MRFFLADHAFEWQEILPGIRVAMYGSTYECQHELEGGGYLVLHEFPRDATSVYTACWSAIFDDFFTVFEERDGAVSEVIEHL
jgi:hypothetical protein